MLTKIFISHSDNKTAAEDAIFDAVLDRLRNCGFTDFPKQGSSGQILIDTSLPLGDLWRQRLFSWLFEADCAIIFCTKLFRNNKRHIAEMRNWLYTEATGLALRRHVGSLKDFFIIVCNGVKFESHPLAALEAIALKEFHYIEITSPADGNGLKRFEDKVRGMTGLPQAADQASMTTFSASREKLTRWLCNLDSADPVQSVARRFCRMRALKALHVGFLNWGGGGVQPISWEQDRALALRLIEGPTATPPDFPQTTTGIRSYADEHVAQWNALLKLASAQRIDNDLVEVVGNSWVGIEMASRLGYAIQSGKRIFHIRIEVPTNPDEPSINENGKFKRILLVGFLAAGAWICMTSDTQAVNVKYVANKFRTSYGQSAPKDTVIDVSSTFDMSELVDRVQGELKPRLGKHSITENPIVVVDDGNFFLNSEGYPDRNRIESFMADCKLSNPSPRVPSVFLFVVSSGSLLAKQKTAEKWTDYAEYEVTAEACQAASCLYKINNDYLLAP